MNMEDPSIQLASVQAGTSTANARGRGMPGCTWLGKRNLVLCVMWVVVGVYMAPAVASDQPAGHSRLIVYRDDVPIMLPGSNGIVYATVNDGGRVLCIVNEADGTIRETTVTLSRVETTDVWLEASNLVSRVPWQAGHGGHRGAVAIYIGDGTIWGQALGSLNLDGFGDVWESGQADWTSEADDLGAKLRHHIACSWKRTFAAKGALPVKSSSPATEPAATEWYIRCLRMAPAEQHVLYSNMVSDVNERLRVALPDTSSLTRVGDCCDRHMYLNATQCIATFRALCTNEYVGTSLRNLNALVSIVDSDTGRWDGGAVVATDADSSLRAGMPVAEVVRSLGAPRTTHMDDAVAAGGSLAMDYATADGMYLRIRVTNNVVDRWLFSNRVAIPKVDTPALWFYRLFLAKRLGWPRCGEWVGQSSGVPQHDRIELNDAATVDTSNGYGWGGCSTLSVDCNGVVSLSLWDESGGMDVISHLSKEENLSLWRVARETMLTVSQRRLSATTGWPTGVSVGKGWGWPSQWEFRGYDHNMLESPELAPLVTAIRTCVSNSLERLPPLDKERTSARERAKESQADERYRTLYHGIRGK